MRLVDFKKRKSFSVENRVFDEKGCFDVLQGTESMDSFTCSVDDIGHIYLQPDHDESEPSRRVDAVFYIYNTFYIQRFYDSIARAAVYVSYVRTRGKAVLVDTDAPVNLELWYSLKFAAGFVLVVLLAEIIAWAMTIPFIRYNPRGELLQWFGLYTGLWLASALASMNMGFGAFFAEYTEKNPIRAASSQGATLTFLSSLLYLFVIVAIVLIPLSKYFQSLFHFTKFARESIVIPGTAIAVLSMLACVGGWHVGLRSMKRDFL